jgi:hypothetical protein
MLSSVLSSSLLRYVPVLLLAGASSVASAKTEWASEAVTFNGQAQFLVYGFTEYNTALTFNFSKSEPGCLTAVTHRLPLEAPAPEQFVRTGNVCTLHTDDGVKVGRHTFPCTVQAFAGSDFMTVLFDTSPPNLKDLMTDAQSAKRIGFNTLGGGEPFWHGVDNLKAELAKGYGYCSKKMPIATR